MPREPEHQLRIPAPEVIVIMENFAATLEEVLYEDAGQTRRPTKMATCLAGLKGRNRQFRRQVREETGATTAGKAVSLNSAISAGRRRRHEESGEGHARRSGLPQYTGGTTGVSKGRC